MQVLFVIPNNNLDISLLTTALEEVKKANIPSHEIDQNAVLALKVKTPDVFVCDPFSGHCFEHLKQLNCRIIGAPCVLECLRRKIAVPKFNYPIFCNKMQGLIISCTNIVREERDKLHCMIRWMGGDFSKSLTNEVTHLIAGEVGSRKYHVAIELKKLVMLPEWIITCWKDAKIEYFTSATDEKYTKFLCPTFQGCVFCVTGFNSVEREEIKELTLSNGGKFCGELDKNLTTHLIAKEPKGTKFEFASKWKIPCLNSIWFYDSINLKACQSCEISHYQMKANLEQTNDYHMTSTPVFKQQYSTSSNVLPQPDISSIEYYNNSIACDSILDLLKSTNKMVSGNFLDGCKIYLSGFRQNHEDFIRKMISTGGGTKFNQLCDKISHVVYNEIVDTDMNYLLNKKLRPHIVCLNWLIKSCQEGKKLSEEPYYNTIIMKHLFDNIKSKTVKGFGLSDSVSYHNQLQADKNSPTVFEKYIDESNSKGIFYQKTFSINGIIKEQYEQLKEVIESAGGILLDDKEIVSIDYGIVPITGGTFTSKITFIVTDCWLRMCSEEGRILDIDNNDLFTPLLLSENLSTILKSCVISISQYIGTERDYLLHIAELLGANCQEYFVRKPKNNLLPNTHLILKEAEGSKYEASLKWNIPAVSKRWLLECAKTGKLVNEEKYRLIEASSNIKTIVPSADFNRTAIETSLESQTPRKFLNPNITYHPKFDVNGMMDSLQMPKAAQSSKKSCLSLDDYFTTNLQEAIKMTNNSDNKPSNFNVLNNVIICVGKKLAKHQVELNKIVSQLGGDYRWSFDTSCTHLIVDRDFDKTHKPHEFYQVAKNKVFIVFADWLYQCKQELKYVDESAYLCYPQVDTTIQPLLTTKSTILSNNKNCSLLSFNTSASTSSDIWRKNELKLNEEENDTVEEEELVRITEEIEQNVKSRSDNEKIQQQLQAIISCKSTKITRLGSYKIKRNDIENTEEEDRDGRMIFIDKSTESSQQGILIGWNDPVGREEREKIKKQLTDKEDSKDGKNNKVYDDEAIQHQIDDTLTIPPIQLQISTTLSTSEPFNKEIHNRATLRSKHPIFLLSTMSQQEKVNYSAVIEQLGGSVYDSQFYNANCTHIIVGQPSRNEKFLASVAAGKWILHKTYIEACREFKRFVDEERYEWGNPSINLSSLPMQVTRLAQAAFHWRKKLEAKRKNSGSEQVGLFDGWKVLLFVQENREAGFKRLLEAGNAEIISLRPPFNQFNGSTHAFIDPQKYKSSNDELNIEDLTQAGIHCLKPEYIAEFIMEDPVPNIKDFLLDEVKLNRSMVTRSKRRAEVSENSLINKRNR